MTAATQRSLGHRLFLALVAVIALLVMLAMVTWAWFALNPVTIVDPPPGVIGLLTAPIPNGPDAATLRRGRQLVIAGDCVSCHTSSGGHPFAGGLGLPTPFGVIYSPNITSDKQTGIGGWTPGQFFAALHRGVDADGDHLYPAFPYTHFTMVPRTDADAMLAYLKTVPPQHAETPANRLPFPLDIRLSMIGWNALNFTPHGFRSDKSRSAAWNHGAYLVQSLGHCGACHTPKTMLGAEDGDHALQGSTIDNWVAPDLTGNPRTGLGHWSAAQIVDYLKTGRNEHSNAAGQMAEVVTYSTSLMARADLKAIATYLKSLKPSADHASLAPEPAAMRAGAAIYADACTACHLTSGRGQPGMFPPLARSAATQQRDPTGVIRLILGGGRTAPTLTHPSFQTMPSFAWKLDDQEVADTATYIRNSWGNQAPPVSVEQVAKLRNALGLRKTLARPASH